MRYRELRWLNPPALPRRTSAHSSRCCLCFQGFNPIHQYDTRFLLKIRKYQRSETRLGVSGEGCTPSSNSSSSPSGSSSSLPSSTTSAARPCLGNVSEFQINYFSHMWISFTRDMRLRIICRFLPRAKRQSQTWKAKAETPKHEWVWKHFIMTPFSCVSQGGTKACQALQVFNYLCLSGFGPTPHWLHLQNIIHWSLVFSLENN